MNQLEDYQHSTSESANKEKEQIIEAGIRSVIKAGIPDQAFRKEPDEKADFNMEVTVMTLRPIADRVVLKRCEAETTTKSGIVLAASAQEKKEEMEVIAVGPGKKDVVMEVSVGQKVICGKYKGTTVKDGDVEYVIVDMEDIVAIVE